MERGLIALIAAALIITLVGTLVNAGVQAARSQGLPTINPVPADTASILRGQTTYQQLFNQHNLRFIFLVTPETSEERIRKIDSLTSGFLYAVSSSSTTGNNKAISDQTDYFKKLQSMQLNNPILVGFGIKDKATFQSACAYTNGAIIGSAYIKTLQNTINIQATTKEFLNSITA